MGGRGVTHPKVHHHFDQRQVGTRRWKSDEEWAQRWPPGSDSWCLKVLSSFQISPERKKKQQVEATTVDTIKKKRSSQQEKEE